MLSHGKKSVFAIITNSHFSVSIERCRRN